MEKKKKSMLIVLSTFVFCILKTMTFSGVTLTFSRESLNDSVTGLQIISAHQGDVMATTKTVVPSHCRQSK